MNMAQRSFIPGSQWLYVKIYSGVKTVESLLIKEIYSLIVMIEKQQWVDKWFFIRYADPDTHLRIRFLLKDRQYTSNILNLFHKKLNQLMQENIIWKVQIDTYNRELERYGSSLIEEAESIFWIDGETVLSIIKKLSIYGNEHYRWMICLKMIDCLLSDFSFTITGKQQLMETVSHAYKIEFGFNEYNSKQFNTKFRENKTVIESIFNDTIDDKNFLSLYRFIRVRSQRLIPIVELIKKKLEKKNVDLSLNNLLASYIHMMINRLFLSKNRVYELILYDFMRRYYTSEIAKVKYNIFRASE
jgi:thiopeptide-type bacteriocin biosynthesis protein